MVLTRLINSARRKNRARHQRMSKRPCMRETERERLHPYPPIKNPVRPGRERHRANSPWLILVRAQATIALEKSSSDDRFHRYGVSGDKERRPWRSQKGDNTNPPHAARSVRYGGLIHLPSRETIEYASPIFGSHFHPGGEAFAQRFPRVGHIGTGRCRPQLKR